MDKTFYHLPNIKFSISLHVSRNSIRFEPCPLCNIHAHSPVLPPAPMHFRTGPKAAAATPSSSLTIGLSLRNSSVAALASF